MLSKVLTVNGVASVSTEAIKQIEFEKNLTDDFDFSRFQEDEELDLGDEEFLRGIADLLDDPVQDLIASRDVKTSGDVNTYGEEDETKPVEIDVKSVEQMQKAEYRKAKIRLWKEKRKRRSFSKKVVCKARGDVAKARKRVGGRFVKSTSVEWVSVTDL